MGVTKQWLKNRMSLHKSDCRTKKNRCALAAHCLSNDHTFDFDDVKILDHEKHYTNRLFLEMYNIHLTNNTINFKTDVEGMSNIYSYIIEIDKSNRRKINCTQNDSDSLVF